MASKENSEPVIVLDDDEPGKSKAKICINYECQSGVDLLTAPNFCYSLYRVRNDKGSLKKICQECYDSAVEHYSGLFEHISSGGNLGEVDIPIRNETFALDDSDEDNDNTEKEEYLDEKTQNFLEEHFDEVMAEICTSLNLDDQIDQTIKTLNKKHEDNEAKFMEIKNTLSEVRKELDGTLVSLSNALRVENVSEPPLVIDDRFDEIISPPEDLPSRGTFSKPPIKVGEEYYAKRASGNCSFVKVRLVEIFLPGTIIGNITLTTNRKKVLVFNNQNQEATRLVSSREMAYSFIPPTLLEVGTRVIALFCEYNENVPSKKDAFYAGVVGERPGVDNKYRYLIFFDDGYAHYISHRNVFPICESSPNVWDDIQTDAKEFIKKYLAEYPNRSMVKLNYGECVQTEFRGKWYTTRVINLDCSLVQLYFETQLRREWIYRGSRRLDAMFREGHPRHRPARAIASAAASTSQQKAPYVEYTRDDDDDVIIINDVDNSKSISITANDGEGTKAAVPDDQAKIPATVEQQPTAPVRAVAKKSTRPTMSTVAQRQPATAGDSGSGTVTNAAADNAQAAVGKIVYYTPKRQKPDQQIYKAHPCNPNCRRYQLTNLSRLKSYSPLAKPILCGYLPMHYKIKNKQPFVVYKTPCGRTVRNMHELHNYLLMTDSDLTVDLFCFDVNIRCLAEFTIDVPPICKDHSNGLEVVEIPVSNVVDNVENDFKLYATQRMPRQGVPLNLDEEFLVGCDCEDDCADKSKCSCWQLTLQGKQYLNRPDEEIGYEYRRLKEPIFTGIYECNSRCKCKHTCLNRVVQNPLSHRLQLFRTPKCGWGLRCVNDIPQGAFVCTYAGELLTEQMANEGGKNHGDEYLAELDYIESAEAAKEGYEEEAYDSDRDKDEKFEEDEDKDRGRRRNADQDFVSKVKNDRPAGTRRSLRIKPDTEETLMKIAEIKQEEVKKVKEDDLQLLDSITISDDEDVREPSSFNPSASNDPDEKPRKYPSVRQMYGKNETAYIMDAKYTGNIGRYLNHSCNPNLFVQNVFVDTHDLRFPWISFFAINHIRAGSELTWNYNYDVGSVEGKVMFCHCGSAQCKGRLL